MAPEEIAALGAAMAQMGIARLELTGPGFALVLSGEGAAAIAQDAPKPGPASQVVPVLAPGLGTFLRTHPLHEAPLAADGEAVAAGQALALLRIGPLLLPVPAPAAGTVVAALPDEETLVGYGDRLFDFLPDD